MRLAVAVGCSAIVLAGCAAAGGGGGGGGGAETTPAIVLHAVVKIADNVDTLVTSIAPGRVRVTHRSGTTILDTTTDRFLVLDPASSTFRTMTLARWEESVRESPVQRGDAPADTLRFEAMDGIDDKIAGYACRRWHVYARREVFPGDLEDVEEEIWVTDKIKLDPAARAAWERVQASLDRVALDAPARRPRGIALRSTVRRRPANKGPEADEIETTEVFRVERRRLPVAHFEIPAGWARADSALDHGDAPPMRQE